MGRRKIITISDRLKAICEMVDEGAKVADIGCDHGYVPIWLVQKKRAVSAIAMDIGEGPLEVASENVENYGVSDKIECRRSNGLALLNDGEADTVIIAGMGGKLMEEILSAYPEKLAFAKTYILQPQSDIPHFRQYLDENGFDIVDEKMLIEDGKYYFVIKAIYDGVGSVYCVDANEDLKRVFYKYGKLILTSGNKLMREYLEKERSKFREIKRNLSSQGTRISRTRLKEVETEIADIETAIKYAG